MYLFEKYFNGNKSISKNRSIFLIFQNNNRVLRNSFFLKNKETFSKIKRTQKRIRIAHNPDSFHMSFFDRGIPLLLIIIPVNYNVLIYR